METLDAILGGDNIRCIHIQPRTVPPEDEGGYTSWHRVRLPFRLSLFPSTPDGRGC